MPKQNILVLHDDERWTEYLVEVFEDTRSEPRICKTAEELIPLMRKGRPDVVFANAKHLSQPLLASLATERNSNACFRAFHLGDVPKACPSHLFDDSFRNIPTLSEFHKRLAQHLPLKSPVRILVVDDEPSIGEAFKEYFGHRTNPVFEVETVTNGLEGQKKIEQNPPDVLILDIKMPEKDGRELYRDLKKRNILPPTIIFFDIVSSEEVLEIRRQGGHPSFVEKGSFSSSMPEMAALIKKIAYFG